MTYADIPGWFDFSTYYDNVIAVAPPLSILVEIGVWHGRSVIYLAEKAKAADKGLMIYAVDIFKGSPEHQEALQGCPPGWLFRTFNRNIRDCNVERFIVPVTMPSTEAAKLFEDASVFSAFIDAEHSYEAVKADITAWLPKVRPGGFLAGHDYHLSINSVAQAVDELLPSRALMGSTWIHQL